MHGSGGNPRYRHFYAAHHVSEVRWGIILAVIFYQRFLSAKLGKQCLFKESCSRRILREARTTGSKAAFSVFYYRLKNCRPGYQIVSLEDREEPLIVSRTGEVLPMDEINPAIYRRSG